MEKQLSCQMCRYYSTHWVGKPFKVENLCSHPRLMYYAKRNKVYHKVQCEAMRDRYGINCGSEGKLWEPMVM